MASRALLARGWPKFESLATGAATIGGENKPLELTSRARPPVTGLMDPEALRKQRSHRDPRSGGITR